ncbi:MAG: squalene synthase HpnC [Ignavibacteria bacterium]|nr:squalene synthase HpnC [Ignavibacteria bacterium]
MENSKINYDYSYNYCKKIAVSHYENFPVGSLLIPKNKRKYIYSIYAFARYADDIADSDIFSEKEKLEKLNELENELNKIESDDLSKLISGTENIFIALYDTIKTLNIPVTEFRNLLIAFKQDSVKSDYRKFGELISYSEYSANPIGHIVLYVFGYNTESDKEAFESSDKICTALQLTNFWQDVSEDLKINRVYIPEEVMAENNYSYNLLSSKTENENFINIIKFLISKTRKLFEEGKGILNLVKGRLRLELKATIAGGEAILKKIEEINYRVLSQRVSLGNIDKLKLFHKIIL